MVPPESKRVLSTTAVTLVDPRVRAAAEEPGTPRGTENRVLGGKDTSLLESGKGYFTSQYATICPSLAFS